jgi:DNA repair exonuclease SbcCD ATPase subunit
MVECKRSLRSHEQAREVIREVGIKTQQQLQYHISDITSLALEAVFNDPYTLTVEFVQRRNKTECDLYFERGGNKVDPLSASGGGAVDVAAFALRIASWSMQRPRTRNVIILDEPFKHLKGVEANQRVLDMINEISRKMKVQIIMVSDERIPREDIIASADKLFEVSIKNGVSRIKSES